MRRAHPLFSAGPAKALALGLVLASATQARVAEADEPGRRFAGGGAVIVSVDRLLPLVSHTRQKVEWSEGSVANRVEDSGTAFAFAGREPSLGAVHTVPRLAIDVGLGGGLTVGTSFAFAVGVAGPHAETRSSAGLPDVVRENDAPRGTLLGFAPRVGYALPLTRTLAVWPRAGFSFHALETATEESSSAAVIRTETTDTLFSLGAEAQVVWTPFEHVVLLAGPVLDAPLMGAHATTLEQGGVVKERSDDLRVWHFGLSCAMGFTFDL